MALSNNNRDAPGGRSTWSALLILSAVLIFTVVIRVPGVNWLIGDGYMPDYSFMGDDQRFVDLTKDVEAGMRDGYVQGMTAHALALRAIVAPVVPDPNSLQLLRVVSIFFAALTVLVTFFVARSWSLSIGRSLLAALFLTTSPTYLVYANFGAADVTAVFYFYMALFMGAKYLRTRDPLWFVLAGALTGAAIAVKLVISLLVPLALIVLVHRGRDLFTKALTALLVVAGSFEVFSYFAYTPWDFLRFVETLRDEVISIPGGNGPMRQLALYIWDLPSALSIPVAALLFWGIATWLIRSIRRVPGLSSKIGTDWSRWLTNPAMPFIAAFATQLFLLLSAGTHVVRHQLFFFPAACIFAAHVVFSLLESTGRGRLKRPVVIGLLVAYAIANSITTELLYVRDIRAEVARWVDESRSKGKTVLALTQWNHIRGTEVNTRGDPLSFTRDTYLVTCDIEYITYLRPRDARGYAVLSGIATGGLARANFFVDAFEGRSAFHIVRTIRQAPISPEQKLIDMQILRPLGTSVPKRCLMLARDDTPAVNVERTELWPPFYYTAAW